MITAVDKASVKQLQNEWERSLKGVITKSFFPKIADRLKLRINATPNLTTIVTEHGHIKTYLSFVHSVVCLTTGPKPLPNRALHIVRSRASSFKCIC